RPFRLLGPEKVAPASFSCKTVVHNGKLVRSWSDIWHPIGRLIEVAGDQGRLKLGIARTACIADVLEESVEDSVLWKSNDKTYGKVFSVSSTLEMVRVRREHVPWHRLLWFAQGIPRFAFIVWLAIRDRLSTGVKMRAWDHVQGCLFCGEQEETRDHLYFVCPYTYTLWLEVIGTLLQPAPTPYWEENVNAIMAGSHDRDSLSRSRSIIYGEK
ncbi:hypothetical protein DY000_02056790, partial [Brassica cretica]